MKGGLWKLRDSAVGFAGNAKEPRCTSVVQIRAKQESELRAFLMSLSQDGSVLMNSPPSNHTGTSNVDPQKSESSPQSSKHDSWSEGLSDFAFRQDVKDEMNYVDGIDIASLDEACRIVSDFTRMLW